MAPLEQKTLLKKYVRVKKKYYQYLTLTKAPVLVQMSDFLPIYTVERGASVFRKHPL